MGYTPEELASVPREANLGLGCGNPLRAANLQPGETVIDLGSGAGLDVFLAANQVGRRGKAVGVDMTPACTPAESAVLLQLKNWNGSSPWGLCGCVCQGKAGVPGV